MSNIVKVNEIYAPLPQELQVIGANDYNNLAYKCFVMNNPANNLLLSRYIKDNPPRDTMISVYTMQKKSVNSVLAIVKSLCNRISHELSIDNRVSEYSFEEIINHTYTWNMLDFFAFSKKAGSGQYKQQFDTTKNGLTIDLLLNWIKLYDESKLDDIRVKAKDEQVLSDFNIKNIDLTNVLANKRIELVRSKRMAFFGSIKRTDIDEELDLKITQCVSKIQSVNNLISALNLGGDTEEVKENKNLLTQLRLELDSYYSEETYALTKDGSEKWKKWIESWYGEFVPFYKFEKIDGAYLNRRMRNGIAYLYDNFGWVDTCVCLNFSYNDTNGYEPEREEFIDKICKSFVEREFLNYRALDLDSEEVPLFRYEWDWYRFRLLFGNFINKNL